MDFKCGELHFNFSKGFTRNAQTGEQRNFKIKPRGILVQDGKGWSYGHFDSLVTGMIKQAYEDWQFERIVLRND